MEWHLGEPNIWERGLGAKLYIILFFFVFGYINGVVLRGVPNASPSFGVAMANSGQTSSTVTDLQRIYDEFIMHNT